MRTSFSFECAGEMVSNIGYKSEPSRLIWWSGPIPYREIRQCECIGKEDVAGVVFFKFSRETFFRFCGMVDELEFEMTR